MKNYSIQELKNRFQSLGHKWPIGVHIVGIRALKEIDDTFCDTLIVFSPNAEPVIGVGTTVPARFYLLKLLNTKGAAVLKEGQYIDSWQIGFHNGYKALVQVKPVTVYRDSNRDTIIDENPGTEDIGMFGIDIHKYVSWISKWLGNSSAGCQVWQDIHKFESMMAICSIAPQLQFTYTLINEF